jgi:hypothetical protein
MDIILEILKYVAAGAIAYAVFRYWHRGYIDNVKAAFWANVKEPLIYMSQDIDDDQVLQRVENAREKLAKHGNTYIKPADVHFFVFGTDADNAAWDFEAWREMRLQQAIDIRKAFRELKSRQMNDSGNQFGAARIFGNQQPPITQN